FAGTTGKIAGRITDRETGDPLIGANVIIDGTTLGAASNMDGYFVILNIPPGTYSLRTTMIGYTTIVSQNLRVSIDLTTTHNASMSVEALGGKEVVVTAERPLVTMDRTSSETRISAEQLDAMPVDNIWDVISIQGGVTKDAGGGIHIRGGRSSEVAYWVDGVSKTDVYDGGLAVNVDNTAVQELQVISGTFNAEYGQAMSGIINLVTKDGSDDYTGSLSGWGGGYYSTDPIYRDLDELDLNNESNLQFSLSGPVPLTGNRLTFYTTARKYRSNGHLKALDAFDKYEGFTGKVIFPEDAPQDLLDALDFYNIDWAFTMPDGYEEFDYGGYLVDPDAIIPLAIVGQYSDYRLAAKIVPFSWRERLTTNSKLTMAVTDRLKLRLSYLTNEESYQDYEHEQQLVPDGELDKFNEGRDISLSMTHSITSNTFYSLRLADFYKKFKEYEFESPTDPRYIDPNFVYHLESYIPPIYAFDTWGINMHRFQRQSNTRVAKFDLTSQLNYMHQVQFGGEIKKHHLTLDDYDITDVDETDLVFEIEIPEKAVDSYNRDYYDVKPQELGLYIQDKIEHRNVIINIGVRWDWFDAAGEIPTNPAEPYLGNPRNSTVDSMTIAERRNIDWTPFAQIYDDSSLIGKTGWWTPTEPVSQLSPRIGIAYPITEKGVIHFSFGHFFQIPTFNHLYDNPGYKVPETSGRFGIFPNAALKPQQTVMYELGLSQAFAQVWSVDLTTFYRDVRNWVSTGVPVDMGGGASYYGYVNKDYENVRGITLDVERHFRDYFAATLNYSFQVIEGSNSNPDDEYGAIERDEEPPRSIIPLEWDQRHTVNGTLFLGTDYWGATLLGRFGSGYPYTPENVAGEGLSQNLSVALVENSRRKPITYSFDLKLFYTLPLVGFNAQAFVNIYNLFDRRNEQTVYGNTGRTNRDLTAPSDDNEAYAHFLRPNKLSDFFNRPDWYSPPRQIQVGLNVSF
ncbi:MAG: TonB-dependent receptor, partial [Candidatus Marinimicrobia bacterium]|nr:TonB-dependent receptor [Candidatus Neomarinimicrobiota bacterium]